MKVIREIERLSAVATPSLHLLPLQYVEFRIVCHAGERRLQGPGDRPHGGRGRQAVDPGLPARQAERRARPGAAEADMPTGDEAGQPARPAGQSRARVPSLPPAIWLRGDGRPFRDRVLQEPEGPGDLGERFCRCADQFDHRAGAAAGPGRGRTADRQARRADGLAGHHQSLPAVQRRRHFDRAAVGNALRHRANRARAATDSNSSSNSSKGPRGRREPSATARCGSRSTFARTALSPWARRTLCGPSRP